MLQPQKGPKTSFAYSFRCVEPRRQHGKHWPMRKRGGGCEVTNPPWAHTLVEYCSERRETWSCIWVLNLHACDSCDEHCEDFLLACSWRDRSEQLKGTATTSLPRDVSRALRRWDDVLDCQWGLLWISKPPNLRFITHIHVWPVPHPDHGNHKELEVVMIHKIPSWRCC